MIGKITAVTMERFVKGYTYAEYVDRIKVNKERFQQYYNGFSVGSEDATFLRQLACHPNGPAKVIALGEDWCPDVYRGIPTITRVAEAAGLEMRIFPRDENLDIMEQFLKDGKHKSIPTFVFYTADQEYIYHWIERPLVANREISEIEVAIRDENPSIGDREFGRERRKRMVPRFPNWQQETVNELKEALEKAIGAKSISK